MIALVIVLWSSLAADRAFAQVATPMSSRLIDVVEVTKHGNRVTITASFNCSLRYLTHFPARHGRRLRVRLQPLGDCGFAPLTHILSEIPPLSGPRNIVSSVRVSSDAPGQAVLTIIFRSDERFMLSQGVSLRALQIQLLPPARPPGRMSVGSFIEHPTYFAVNLTSQRTPFLPSAVRNARSQLQTPVFVSKTVVDGQEWYRLRAGPFELRENAERVLRAAVASYPTAWVAVGQYKTGGAGLPPVSAHMPPTPRIGTAVPLAPRVRARLLSQAIEALRRNQYAAAIRLLTMLQQQPRFSESAHVQELLGLARERAGQLAQAQAEYEAYLRLYPGGPAAARVARRLRILREATLPGTAAVRAPAARPAWRVSGDVAQMYRFDGSRISSTSSGSQPGNTVGPTSPAQTQHRNALYTDVDLLMRYHGGSTDWISRLSAGYTRHFGSSGFTSGLLDNRAQVSLASIEFDDQVLGILARAGRQVRNDDGILGTFDGLFASYHWRPEWGIDVAAGYPVELMTSLPKTRRRFESLAFAVSPPQAHWHASIFATLESFDGLRDRRAVGFQGRYFASRASLVTMLDYDTAFHSLNAAMLLGTVQLPARWSVSFDAERRNSPVLTAENALIGQSAITLLQLERTFTPKQIFQLARDRTPKMDNFSLTITRPLGERFEFVAITTADRTAATPASGGVPAQPSTGLEYSYQAQLFGSRLWSPRDFNALTLTYGKTQIGKIEAVDLSSRLPLVGAWQVGPHVEVARRQITSDASTETTVDPSFIIEYEHGLDIAQLEIGGTINRQSTNMALQRSLQYYVNLSYTIGFQP